MKNMGLFDVISGLGKQQKESEFFMINGFW
ncbi:hypothetical protein SAMN05428978_1002157 [Nitrosomonas sp. Nm34]|nr:hypothetical protein SAMN05428978_1002157 [Nitrosomonas sp. Nm34]